MILPAALHLSRIPSVNAMTVLVKRLLYNRRRMIILLNQKQLQKGQRADGSTIAPPYAKLTIALKTQAGQPTDRVTLKDTGDYYADMRLDLQQDQFTIEDDDIKAEELQDKYGDLIQGLNDANVENVRKALIPDLREGAKTLIQQS